EAEANQCLPPTRTSRRIAGFTAVLQATATRRETRYRTRRPPGERTVGSVQELRRIAERAAPQHTRLRPHLWTSLIVDFLASVFAISVAHPFPDIARQ